MNKIIKSLVAPGLYWVSIPDADLHIQCGCVEDSVKHLIRRGLISRIEKNGISWETGPNTILLSDLMLQGGHFSNLAEFPVLQMLYRQGMGLPDHPNNTGRKPLLIGNSGQIKAQLEYIHRGNYGLISVDELLETGLSEEEAELVWNLKMEFAYGKIEQTDYLIDSIVLTNQEMEIRQGECLGGVDVTAGKAHYIGGDLIELLFADMGVRRHDAVPQREELDVGGRVPSAVPHAMAGHRSRG